MSTDLLLFTLMQARLRALGNDLEFPPELRDQTAPLLALAESSIREARTLYGRINAIHDNNTAKRLKSPGGTQ
ncbi:hypothetical protein FMN50_20400 [Rhodobacterales bacterium]|nr:hypothetical protein FMN50_20400 [Rhodobacterales bacterium]